MLGGGGVLHRPLQYCRCAAGGAKNSFGIFYKTFSQFKQHGATVSGLLHPQFTPHNQSVRHARRGMEFKPNTYKRIKKHGWDTKMKTLNGQITIIRRMLKGVPRRKLTH